MVSVNDLILNDYANKHSSGGSYGVIYALIGSSLRSVPEKEPYKMNLHIRLRPNIVII